MTAPPDTRRAEALIREWEAVNYGSRQERRRGLVMYVAAALDAAERERDSLKLVANHYEDSIGRLTRELKESKTDLTNAEMRCADLREVVEAASVIASCWNTQGDKTVIARYPTADQVRRYFTAWAALAKLEGK